MKKQDGISIKSFFRNHVKKAVNTQMAERLILDLKIFNRRELEGEIKGIWKGNLKDLVIQHKGINYTLTKQNWKKELDLIMPK